jgi:hypothetical protein
VCVCVCPDGRCNQNWLEPTKLQTRALRRSRGKDVKLNALAITDITMRNRLQCCACQTESDGM